MNSVIKTRLSKHKINQEAVSKAQVMSSIKRSMMPAIVINNATRPISVSNGILYTDSSILPLIGKPLIEAVRFLVKNGIDAKITAKEFLFSPAHLVLDFDNVSFERFKIPGSPFDTSCLMPSCFDNYNYDDPSSFYRTIEHVFSYTSDTIYRRFDSIELAFSYGQPAYAMSNDMAFINGIESDTHCIAKFFIKNFCMYIAKENLIDINLYMKELQRHGVDDSSSVFYLEMFESMNRDTY